jgi:hypothetical protein
MPVSLSRWTSEPELTSSREYGAVSPLCILLAKPKTSAGPMTSSASTGTKPRMTTRFRAEPVGALSDFVRFFILVSRGEEAILA